jgi:hypothetical protein
MCACLSPLPWCPMVSARCTARELLPPLTEAKWLLEHRQDAGRGCPTYRGGTSTRGIGFWGPKLRVFPLRFRTRKDYLVPRKSGPNCPAIGQSRPIASIILAEGISDYHQRTPTSQGRTRWICQIPASLPVPSISCAPRPGLPGQHGFS